MSAYTPEELKAIQSLELDALGVLMGVCNRLNIEYFADGGTALGAVRHGGFIPWDDDIDIGMTRENYLRFLKSAPELLPNGYYLQTPYDNKANPYPYAKLRVDGTSFVEYCNRSLSTHHGVYVDIFPFDEVPDNEEENVRQFKRIRRLVKLFVYRQTPDVSVPPIGAAQKARAVVRSIVHLACRAIPHAFILDKIDSYAMAYNGTGQKAMACLFSSRRNTDYGLKETLFPLSIGSFEGLDLPIPHDCDAYLTTLYGNWRELPPPEKRFGHKPYHVDLGNLK